MSNLGTTLLIAALGLFLLGWRFLDPRPRLLVNERGIRHRSLSLGWIRWEEIEGAYPPTAVDGEALHLKLRPTERLRRKLAGRRVAPVDGSTGPFEVRLDLADTDVGAVELLQEILARTGSSSRR